MIRKRLRSWKHTARRWVVRRRPLGLGIAGWVRQPQLRVVGVLLLVAVSWTGMFQGMGFELLDRGMLAVRLPNGDTYLSWRLLESDPPDVAFDVYAHGNGPVGMRKLNARPLTSACNFVVTGPHAGAPAFEVVAFGNGRVIDRVQATYIVEGVGSSAYVRIPLVGRYPVDKLGLADLNGDGKLDFVIKQPESIADPGVWVPSRTTFKIEAYLHDGRFLWRRDLGWNIEQGVWYSPMIVYDLDGDGRAEVVAKTAPVDVDLRDVAGHVLSGPEWFSIFDGLTGAELARADWPARGDVRDWGDATGNRASRNTMGVAYLDGRLPSLIVARGTYTKMVVRAYDFRRGKLSLRWEWCGDNESPPVRGQGMHGMHCIDVDGDGRDEVILGAAVLDDNGRLLWNLGMGHPDIVYITDVYPERPGLEIVYGFETAQRSNGICVVEAETGRLIWGCAHPTSHVHSQGIFGQFDPENPGFVLYCGEKFLPDRWYYRLSDGKLIDTSEWGALAAYPVFWGDTEFKWLAIRGAIGQLGCEPYQHYEGRVVAVADCIGDWREEVITCVPGELRIYVSTIPSTHRRTSLWQDRGYRSGVAHAAMGYFFPPQITGQKAIIHRHAR